MLSLAPRLPRFERVVEHVYLEYPEFGQVVRYVLGEEARQFLHGEFEGGELPEVVLLPPGQVDS